MSHYETWGKYLRQQQLELEQRIADYAAKITVAKELLAKAPTIEEKAKLTLGIKILEESWEGYRQRQLHYNIDKSATKIETMLNENQKRILQSKQKP
jgi:hypothetical protein